MAAFHVRSNSLPSNPNPLAVQVDEHLSRLRSSETASTSSSSTCRNLNDLRDLIDCINKMMLQQSVHQQAVSEEQNMKTVEELLDGTLRLLDVCGVAKDALSNMKESLRDMQSAIRRKSDGSLTEVKKYLACRKSIKKSFQIVSKSLKTRDRKHNEDETMAILRETEAATVEVLASLLCFISGSKSLSKTSSKWALISKLGSKKRTECEEEDEEEEEIGRNEFTKVDSAMVSLTKTKSEKRMKVEEVQGLEKCIEEVEQWLHCLFRSLIELRVSVLNILGN